MACALLTAPAALAATTTTPSGENTPLHLDPVPAAEHTSGGSGGGIVRTIVGLAVVIGVIVGLHWILKQVKSSRESRSTGGGLQPLATLALGPGRSLHLVRAGLEVVLVGCAEHAVTPLRVYSEDEARDLGLLDLGDDDGDSDITPRGPGRKRNNPLNAGPGSPPDLRDLFRRIQRLTVRG
ncbi:MAG TPA: flagellar biosynthetic protein FliO [Solirubrobacteraceae bacterium]|nr:flagellar biosynthetic protein FliO [Solirubrobacteraceae bacterium]